MKKKLIIIIVSSLVLIGVCVSIGIPIIKKVRTNHIRNELFDSYYSLSEDMIVTFENGSYDTEKNSLAYIKSTLENIPDCLEVDIVFNKDSVPYIASNFESITEKTIPLEYLFQLITSKSEYDHIKVALHIVQADNLKTIDTLAEKYHMLERVFYTGVTVNQASYINSQQSQIYFILDYDLDKSKMSDSDYVTQAFMEICGTGAKGVNCNFDSVSKELATMLKENWMMLSVHGMKTDYDFYKALTFSPDIIVTDKPIETKNKIDKWRANAPVEYYGITTTQTANNKK